MGTVVPLFLVALASVTVFGANGGAAKPGVLETKVWALVRGSNCFYKANVWVKAIVLSDLIEHTILVDRECPEGIFR